MRPSLIVDTSVRVLYHSIWVVSLYFLFAGHNQPGGGFVGGLTAGAAIALRYVAGGVDAVRGAVPLRPWTVLGSGLVLASATAIIPMVQGGQVLEHAVFSAELPLLGAIKATSALPFDIGVYLVVLGVVLMMFEAFGGEVAYDETTGTFVPGDALTADALDTPQVDIDRIAELAEQRRVARYRTDTQTTPPGQDGSP